MNTHLKEAVSRYPFGTDKCLIHPISEVDAQIIVEIIELFKKMNFSQAVDILKNYKLYKDDDVALALLELNTTVNIYKKEQADEGEGEIKVQKLDPIRYLTVCGKRLDLYLLIGYEILDINGVDGMRYCIRLNPTPDNAKQVPFYANDILYFYAEESRDNVLTRLDSYFEHYKGLFLG